MKPGPERESLSAYIDGLREATDMHVPEAVRLAGETAVSAWKDGYKSALLLTLEHVLDLT